MIKAQEQVMKVLDQEVKVKNWIPYKDKVSAAEDIVAIATIMDENLGVMCWTYLFPAANMYVRLKYYTEYDVSKFDGEDWLNDVMDAVDKYDMSDFLEFVNEDFSNVTKIAYDMMATVKELFEKEHSLAHKAMQSFAFLFDGKDVTETLAEAREVSEQMIDVLGGKKPAGGKLIDMSQYAKKPGKK